MFGKALIVVDMLNDFVDEKGSLYCGETARDIIPFIKERIDEYHQQGDLVIYLQDTHDENDREFERFPRHCIKGTWGHGIIPELKPDEHDQIVLKRRFSGFFETGLEEILRSHRIDEVEVVGVCTSICVMDTVGDLSSRDYSVTVPRAGVADFDPEFHDFALRRMERTYGAKIV
nr:cysteine hydrolase [Desulfobacterales bacterium]